MDLRVISLGAGVQSTTMYVMAARGDLTPRPDCAIFADTQQEPPWVYEQLAHLEATYDIPIYRASAGDLGVAVKAKTDDTVEGRFASVPFWVKGSDGREAPGRRQCTREFKIDVVKKKIRDLLGLVPKQRATGKCVEEWIGISLDEASRAKPSRYGWIETRWPLLFDLPMTRHECKRYLLRVGERLPEKSACVFCPYRGTAEWLRWKAEHPALFASAVAWDEAIRRPARGPREQQYVSRQLIPLADLEDDLDGQVNLFENECEGMCGV